VVHGVERVARLALARDDGAAGLAAAARGARQI